MASIEQCDTGCKSHGSRLVLWMEKWSGDSPRCRLLPAGVGFEKICGIHLGACCAGNSKVTLRLMCEQIVLLLTL